MYILYKYIYTYMWVPYWSYPILGGWDYLYIYILNIHIHNMHLTPNIIEHYLPYSIHWGYNPLARLTIPNFGTSKVREATENPPSTLSVPR